MSEPKDTRPILERLRECCNKHLEESKGSQYWEGKESLYLLADAEVAIRDMGWDREKILEMLWAKGGRWVGSNEFTAHEIAIVQADPLRWKTIGHFGFIFVPDAPVVTDIEREKLISESAERADRVDAMLGWLQSPDDKGNHTVPHNQIEEVMALVASVAALRSQVESVAEPRPLNATELAIVEAYQREMQDQVIPEIIKTIRKRQVAAANSRHVFCAATDTQPNEAHDGTSEIHSVGSEADAEERQADHTQRGDERRHTGEPAVPQIHTERDADDVRGQPSGGERVRAREGVLFGLHASRGSSVEYNDARGLFAIARGHFFHCDCDGCVQLWPHFWASYLLATGSDTPRSAIHAAFSAHCAAPSTSTPDATLGASEFNSTQIPESH